MGRYKKKKTKRANVYQQDVNKQGQQRTNQRQSYKCIEKENENLELFYKAQNLVPTEEWQTLINCFRDPLPASFRINTFYADQARMLRMLVEGSRFKTLLTMRIPSVAAIEEVDSHDQNQDSDDKNETHKIRNDEDKNGEKESENENLKPALQSLSWYPDRMAWQMNFTRVNIRRLPLLAELHKFLIAETETGHISRQESVSMIPPLLIDVQSGHTVLDMCAAPGSKTAQLIEYMQNSTRKLGKTIETGVVIANDIDNKRCYMLVHQSGRLNAPNCIIINQDAAKLPKFYTGPPESRHELKFDRVLCDVPCSGDGTIRKNLDVWSKWNVQNSNNFHGMQIKIARKGLELLKKNGLLVYSTCSMSPSENESVIAHLLMQTCGAIELVDVSEKLQGLKYLPGLTSWTVFGKDMRPIPTIEDIPKEYVFSIRHSLFPPPKEELKKLHLDRCVRLLPHLQNTGGFFVAVFRKTTDDLPWGLISPQNAVHDQGQIQGHAQRNLNESSKQDHSEDLTGPDAVQGQCKRVISNQDQDWKNVARKRKCMDGFKEAPFIFLSDEDETWCRIKNAFGIDDSFPAGQLLHRCSEGRKRNIYLVSRAGKDFIEANGDRDNVVKLINCGMRIFCRADTRSDDGYRMCQDGVGLLLPYIKKELCIDCQREDLELLLQRRHVGIHRFSEKTCRKFQNLRYGSFILIYKHKICEETDFIHEPELIDIPLVSWRGEFTVVLYVSDNYRIHLASLLGIELTVASASAPGGENSEKQLEVGDNDNVDSEQITMNSEKEIVKTVDNKADVQTS